MVYTEPTCPPYILAAIIVTFALIVIIDDLKTNK